MKVHHRSGKNHTNSDFLSRIDCEQCEVSHSNPKVYEQDMEKKIIRKNSLQQKYYFDQTIDKNIQIMEFDETKKTRQRLPKKIKLLL